MALQLAVSTRNLRVDSVEVDLGLSPILRIRSGAQPASCATADSGTVLASLTLPADWMLAAANGVKAKSGTWEDIAADAGGIAGHFRLYLADGVTCKVQGSITAVGGGGDMEIINTSIAVNQNVQVTQFTLTDANA